MAGKNVWVGRFLLSAIMALALAASGCSGSDGAQGAEGKAQKGQKGQKDRRVPQANPTVPRWSSNPTAW